MIYKEMNREEFVDIVLPTIGKIESLDDLYNKINDSIRDWVVCDKNNGYKEIKHLNKETFYCYVDESIVREYYLQNETKKLNFRKINNMNDVYLATTDMYIIK